VPDDVSQRADDQPSQRFGGTGGVVHEPDQLRIGVARDVGLKPHFRGHAHRPAERGRAPVEHVEGLLADGEHLGVADGDRRGNAGRLPDQRDLPEEIPSVELLEGIGRCVLDDRDLARDDQEHRVALVSLTAYHASGLDPVERGGGDQPPDQGVAGPPEERRSPEQIDELAPAPPQRQPRLQLPAQLVAPRGEPLELRQLPDAHLDRPHGAVDGDVLFAGDRRAAEDAAGPLVADELGDAFRVRRGRRTDLARHEEVEARRIGRAYLRLELLAWGESSP